MQATWSQLVAEDVVFANVLREAARASEAAVGGLDAPGVSLFQS